MKYICLGYLDESKWEKVPEDEQNALMDECFAYDEVLREKGHMLGGEALGPSASTVTLRHRGDRIVVSDGPFAETKEQIGGLLILEARDLNEAVQLMSKHPGVKIGDFEVRPIVDMTEMVRESERRRAQKRSGKTATGR